MNGSHDFAPEWATHFVSGHETYLFMRLDHKDRLLSLGLVWKVAKDIYAGGPRFPSATLTYYNNRDSANRPKALQKQLNTSNQCKEVETK